MPRRAADWLWAALIAALLAASPLTGAKRWLPSLVLGIAAGAVVLAVRLRRRSVESRLAGPAIAWPDARVGVALLAALALFAPTLAWLYAEFTNSIWRNPHGLFVPLFVGLLVRNRLRDDPDPGPESSAWGFALLVPATALAVIDAGVRFHYPALLGLLMALPGLSLLLLGARRTRRLAFPLALCLFLVPLPKGLGDPFLLPTLTVDVGKALVEASGMPVLRSGTRLALADGTAVEVSQNCSGLSIFYAAVALSVLCLGVTRTWPRRLALLVAPYALTALGNGMRLAILMWVGSRIGFGWKFDTPLHGALGTALFFSVLAGVWLVCDRRALREALS